MRSNFNHRSLVRMRVGNSIGGCLGIILILNFAFGGFLVNYILSWFNINIPFWGDTLIGLITAEFALPVALVGWILRLFGVF